MYPTCRPCSLDVYSVKRAHCAQHVPFFRFSTLNGVVNVEDVTEALRDVIDPELGLDFVELGLIYDIAVEGGNVHVTYTLTSPGCPIGPQVSEQIDEFVGELPGVEDVQSTMTFSPPWTPERMSEDAKFALGF
jgi:metal-sulfur cluster biosynthetic enzyme